MVREGVILISLARLITPVDPSIARAKNDFAAHLETHRGSASQMAARQRALITNGAPLFRVHCLNYNLVVAVQLRL